MASIRYNLNRAKGHNYITLIYDCAVGNRLKMSIGQKIEDKQWDIRKQRVKPTHPNATTINTLLSEISLFIERTRNEYKIKGERLTAVDLRKLITNRLYGVNESVFSVYAEKWIKEMDIEPGTKKTIKNAITFITKNWPDITFDQINTKWHKELIKKMSGYSDNYKHLITKKLRQCIQSAYIDGVHKNLFHQNSKFIAPAGKSETVFLSVDEINDIYLNLNKIEDSLKNAAIIVLIGCMTGQRHQTYRTINKNMVAYKGDKKMITMMTEKTNERVTIPVSDKLLKLLNMEYHDISQQKLNEYVKEVCEIVGIEKYKKVSSHTARRSFATNAVLAGIDMHLIMKITGHKTESEFRKYVRIDDLMAADKSYADINLMQI